MLRAFLLSGLALAALLGGSAIAEPIDGEFGNECTMGLAFGQDIATDCSVNTNYNGRTYCFGNEVAKTLFLKKPEEFLLRAHIYYASKQQQSEK